MHKISALKQGDTIGIAAISSPFDQEALRQGVDRLRSMGFKVLVPQDIFEKENDFLAGKDELRASVFQQLIENKEVKAIFFARGGYGAQRIMRYLDWEKIKQNPKIILGYSDITTLFLYLIQNLSWPVFHGPVVAKGFSSDWGLRLESSFKQFLCQNDWPSLSLENLQILKQGSASGKLLGGCLTLLQSSLKLPWEINLKNQILFLEDVGEAPYRIDRMLQHLKLAGKFEGLAGVLCAGFQHPSYGAHLYHEVILDCFETEDIPIVYGFPSGHHPDMHILPLGVMSTLDTKTKELRWAI